MNKITLSGFAGTGKSTVGKILRDKLGYEFVSVGDFSRDYAQKRGLTINEFQEKCKKEPEPDDLIDEKFKQLCNEKENMVADYRLGFHFVKNAFNVLLKVSDKVAAERIKKANRKKENTDIESIKKRNQEMKQRFINKYGIDFTNENNYDLVINTDNPTPENIADTIISQMQNIEKMQLDLEKEKTEFIWSVTTAEITFEKDTKELIRYKLFSKDGTEQAHSIKIKNNVLDYWHLEIKGRYGYPIEDSIQDFTRYYYENILKDSERAKIESSLPRVWYRIENRQLYCVGYNLTANRLTHFSPLFSIYFKNGYLWGINDTQFGNKEIIFPIPAYPERYVVQEFNNKTHKEAYHEEKIKNKTEKTIIFRGFNEYETKCFVDSEAENNLQSHGFFIPELRNIINNAELLLKYIPTVNYHIIKPCNMKCKHCFSDYNEIQINSLPFEKAQQIIQEIAKIKSFKKLNFSGGEPTMYKDIEKLIQFAKDQGLETSMVTNGYNLIKQPELLDKLKGKLAMLALSIDCFDHELNLKIGRFAGKQQTISCEDFLLLASKCRDYGIKIKVNSVISKLNYNQILADKIADLKPVRWKILRMLPVESQNDKAKELFPTDGEYELFIGNNKEQAEKVGIKVVSEGNEDMTGSYLMIAPDGRFFNNVEGKHNFSEPILETGIEKALEQTPLRREVFYKREGDYSCD
jgi:predicted cytidylate kinase